MIMTFSNNQETAIDVILIWYKTSLRVTPLTDPRDRGQIYRQSHGFLQVVLSRATPAGLPSKRVDSSEYIHSCVYIYRVSIKIRTKFIQCING